MKRLPEMLPLIERQKYFIIHAPRQVGKTTAIMGLARELTGSGGYVSVVLSVETGAAAEGDIDAAAVAISGNWWQSVLSQLPPELRPAKWEHAGAGAGIRAALDGWSRQASRPLVIFIDEIDALRDLVLISVLRQLRDGYRERPHGFPASLALIGVRNVRDHKATSGGSERLHSASPFNILGRALTMRNFNAEEVAELYGQHTGDTGQQFTPLALARAFELTQGQPWLVNALAKVCVEELVPDAAKPVMEEHIDAAKEILIQRQETHLDSLAERLREPRVRAIIEPIMAGELLPNVPDDDVRYVPDLGLCRTINSEGLTIANPIYREVLPRVLARVPSAPLPQITPIWLKPDGRLDPARLLDAFLTLWRQHGQPLMGSAPYHEIAPHLVLMAFLHRVVNARGTIDREYAIGSGRMDLCVRLGPAMLALELKVWREGRPDPLHEGLKQFDDYLTGLGLATGWLVIFDRRPGQPPLEERTSATTAQTPCGWTVSVIRG
jgi:hypothetical protein